MELRRLKSFTTGLTLGIAAALAGRRAMSNLKTNRGRPWTHRVVDLDSAFLQRKYPLSAMSTYLDAAQLRTPRRHPDAGAGTLLHPMAADRL